MAGVHIMFFHFLIIFSIFTMCRCGAEDPECIYAVYVQTGSIQRAGTHSVISLNLFDEYGAQVVIPNLEEDWGLMGSGYNYFETGNLDIFGGRGPCLTGPVCGLNLTSDGSGPYHGWYCDYVDVTTVGVGKQCSQQHFTVEQWLATDSPPYQLTAVRNTCSSGGNKRLIHGSDSSVASSD